MIKYRKNAYIKVFIKSTKQQKTKPNLMFILVTYGNKEFFFKAEVSEVIPQIMP
jgi:hypothetical protein